MPRRWTDQQRRAHAAFRKHLHQQRLWRHHSLPAEVRVGIAAALRAAADPKATDVMRRFGVAHSTVCIIARAEGIELKPGRRARVANE
jgi:hypothetical protein